MEQQITGYDFFNYIPDGESLVHLINLMLGKDLVGVELGVFRAENLCSLLQKCPNIKTLYGIDKFEPYTDSITAYETERYAAVIDIKEIEHIKLTAHHNIKYSGMSHKAVLIEKDTSEAVKKFKDESLDFIFMDAYLDYKQAFRELHEWYPKVKKGGIFAGHDAFSPSIQKAVEQFRKEQNINNTLSVSNNTWIWLK